MLSVPRSEQFSKSIAEKTVSFEEQIIFKDMLGYLISQHIFTPNGGYCVQYSLNIFTTQEVFKIREYYLSTPRCMNGNWKTKCWG